MEISQVGLRLGDYKIECGSDPEPSSDKNKNRVWIVEDSLVDNIGERTNPSEANDDGQLKEEESSELTRPEILAKNAKNTENIYNVATVVIPSELLELSLSIKRETEDFNANSSSHVSRENSCSNFSISREKVTTREGGSSSRKASKLHSTKENETRIIRTRQLSPKRDDCTSVNVTKLYTAEIIERSSKEDARQRETTMYYETPEKRRKRLDNEAARKREYRMYNETSDERRKRLDREAERRRLKRLTIYANETPEEKRDRLNRESSRRRESRLNQYANETEEDRQTRLEKDATRAREMRFTRSAIESDEERRVRLLKDALRKRELRMQHGDDRLRNIVELRTMMNLDEYNDTEREQQSPEHMQQQDHHFTGHCVSNWMMWFQNTIGETVNETDKNCQTQTDA